MAKEKKPTKVSDLKLPQRSRKTVTGFNVSKESWERIFGSEEDRLKRVKAFNEKRRKERDEAEKLALENKAPEARTDRDPIFRDYFDIGLGVHIRDRQHRNQVMKEKGFRCIG